MWLLLLLVFILTGLTLVYSYVQWTRRKMYAMLATMSSPKTLPVIGHAHKFYNLSPSKFQPFPSTSQPQTNDQSLIPRGHCTYSTIFRKLCVTSLHSHGTVASRRHFRPRIVASCPQLPALSSEISSLLIFLDSSYGIRRTR